jgi:hypothetical protein
LDAYVENEGTFLGYRLGSVADSDKLAQRINAYRPANFLNSELAADLRPGEALVSHFVDRGQDSYFKRDPKAGVEISKGFEQWLQSGEIIHANGTFYASTLADVMSGPQAHEYKHSAMKTLLDLAHSKIKAADCNTFALERYTLLQEMAARGKINATPADVFMLTLISTIPKESNHVIAGYVDKVRGPILFEGTGWRRLHNGKIERSMAYAFEPTKRGIAELATTVRSALVDGTLIPAALYRNIDGQAQELVFDSIRPNPGPDGRLVPRVPEFPEGLPNPVTAYDDKAGPASYMEAFAAKKTPLQSYTPKRSVSP